MSASSSKRWLNCTPSARLEEQFAEETGNSVYAEEGTAAHALAEHKLKRCLKRRSKRPVSLPLLGLLRHHRPHILNRHSLLRIRCFLIHLLIRFPGLLPLPGTRIPSLCSTSLHNLHGPEIGKEMLVCAMYSEELMERLEDMEGLQDGK